MVAINGVDRTNNIYLADSNRPGQADQAAVPSHAARKQELGVVVLLWMGALAKEAGAPFDADAWSVVCSPPTLQQQVEDDCGVFSMHWGAVHLSGGNPHFAPRIDTLRHRDYIKNVLIFVGMSEAHGLPVSLAVSGGGKRVGWRADDGTFDVASAAAGAHAIGANTSLELKTAAASRASPMADATQAMLTGGEGSNDADLLPPAPPAVSLGAVPKQLRLGQQLPLLPPEPRTRQARASTDGTTPL